ncbi:hypothetical protein FWH58_00900 [Candidatus Saccharibacteria bacterium]|nr:hypothetical protein [Candidatus Saccharibacteria bacterium]
MKRLGLIVVGLAAIASLGLAFAPGVVRAEDDGDECTPPDQGKYFDGECYSIAEYNIRVICAQSEKEENKPAVCDDLEKGGSDQGVIGIVRNVINILLFIGGIIAVIVIIVSGIRFASSRGDSNAVTKARQNIVYAVAGLVIMVVAFAVVNFVIAQLNK